MPHDVNNLRIKDVYNFIEQINNLVEKSGLQLILSGYHFRSTSTKAEQTCSWCKKQIGANNEHFYMNNTNDDFEPAVRMHMGRCLQEYLTETINKARKIFCGPVDTRWEELVYYDGKPQRRI